jgi:two-component system, sensor histidine kinase RpfC
MKATLYSSLPGFLQRLVKRVQGRPDTEFQQALIRFAIGAIAYLYFSSSWIEHPEYIYSSIHFVALFFLSTATLILAGALTSQRPSPSRRLFGAVVDFSTATFLLLIGGESSAPLVGIYLWVTLGNGFRYGVSYLYCSTVLAALGFGAVLAFNSFWNSHLALGIGILITMVIVPLYAAALTRQLHAAVQRANEASLAKSSFLANMSHELRTPLNGVIGVADLLGETPLNKEQKELSQIIRASANTLLELIDNVLDISRIEAGRVVSVIEDFDLHRLVNGTAAMMEPMAQAKGLTLATHISPQTPFHLHGDARHLRQILINLIGNAIKFTDHGRVEVTVSPATPSQPQRLRFEVTDTGIGISEAAQARIFDSFTQADPSVTRRFGGSGLGTTIAKQLVETLGGQVGLHSIEGKGTTVWFELPFEIQKAVFPAPEEQFETPMRVAILAGSALAARVQTAIRSWGAETVMVDNHTSQPVAELSVCLPGDTPLGAVVVERSALQDDPVAFLRRLCDDPGLAALPIILIESDPAVAPANDAQLIREGYASVLRTPVNSTLLFNAIHAVVSQDMPSNVVSLAKHFRALAGNASGLRILVAEDNPVNQRVIRGLLEHAGHQAYLAHDGEEALSMLESADPPYHLAIIDMHMPELSGPEVVQRWRFMETGHLPIIMLTADVRAEAQAACEEAGADTFLTKPVNSRKLIDVIARLASQQAQPVAAPAPAGTAKVLEESVLNDLVQMGGAAFVQDLLASFAEESERALRDIERALVEREYGQWLDHLHKLKGGAGDVGANQLAQLCAEAERIKPYEMAGAGAAQKLDAVRLALARAQAALTAYLDRKLRAEGT